MKTDILESKLKVLLNQKLGEISGAVKLGDSIRTFDQWNRAGFMVKKGQTAVSIKVGESVRFYFWWTQVWNLARYEKWKKRQANIKKENSFSFEPSGGI